LAGQRVIEKDAPPLWLWRETLATPAALGEATQSPVECFQKQHCPLVELRGHESERGACVPMLTFNERVAAPAHVLVRFLDQESVLLNLETEQYFGLDETGTRMWQLVTTSPNIDTAYQGLLEEYDVQPELLRENLTELLGHLVEHGLLQVLPPDAGKPAAI
jgi:hypothetical protein